MTPKAASRSLCGTTQLLRYKVLRSLRGFFEVSTVTTQSLRGHYGHAVRKHMFEAEKTLNFAPKALFNQEIVAVDLEVH